jgi:hypothetical protein
MLTKIAADTMMKEICILQVQYFKASSRGWMSKAKAWLRRVFCRQSRLSYAIALNRSAIFRKRAVLSMATGYAIAWFITFTPFLVFNYTKTADQVFLVIVGCTLPLQGLFNFLVFMSPKVRYFKTRAGTGDELSWIRSCLKAY